MNTSTQQSIHKIVLAYSGGLDTSIIIPWLKEHYKGAEVVCICTNVGQTEDWKAMEQKALASGASKLVVKDVREEFAAQYLFPMLRSGAIYDGKYLLGTSIARPLQAKHQVELALHEGANALAHGCTGKGNDQVRFELTYKALAPHLYVIAPWRIWDISSREDSIAYAKKHNIPIGNVSKSNIYSRDSNIWHTSHEGGDLENPWNRPKEQMFLDTQSPQNAPDAEHELSITFEKGIPTAVDGNAASPISLLEHLNKLGSKHGIGRADIVETRLVGMKSRGVYETPAGTILYKALRELEMITMDSETLEVKNMLALKYANAIYAGKWFTHFRETLEHYMQRATQYVTGEVRLSLYKGNVMITGRKSPYSLYIESLASFDSGTYNHADASGFINLYGLSTGVQALVHKNPSIDEGPAHDMREMAGFSEK